MNLCDYIQKVLPTVYDDSLSYADQIGKLTKAVYDITKESGDIPSLVDESVKKYLTEDNFSSVVANLLTNYVVNVKYPPAGVPAAKGDGIADDTASFQGCIDYLSKGGVLFVPQGVYNVGSLTDTTGVSFCGMDRENTQIVLLPNASHPLLSINGGNISIRNIAFNGNLSHQSNNIILVQVFADRAIVESCTFDQSNILMVASVADVLQANNLYFGTANTTALSVAERGIYQFDNIVFSNLASKTGAYFLNAQCNNSVFKNITFKGAATSLINCTGNHNLFDCTYSDISESAVYAPIDTKDNTVIYNGVRVNQSTKSWSLKTTMARVNATNVQINANAIQLYSSNNVQLHGEVVEIAPTNSLQLPLVQPGQFYDFLQFDESPTLSEAPKTGLKLLVENAKTAQIGPYRNYAVNAKSMPPSSGVPSVTGDGVTDDTLVLQRIINWCELNGAILLLPCKCLVTASILIPSNFTLIGTGANAGFIWGGTAPGSYIVKIASGATMCHLESISFSVNAGASTPSGIYCDRLTNSVVQNLSFQNCNICIYSEAVSTEGETQKDCSNNVFQNVTSENCNTFLFADSDSRGTFTHNVFANFRGVTNQSGFRLNKVNGCLFINLAVGVPDEGKYFSLGFSQNSINNTVIGFYGSVLNYAEGESSNRIIGALMTKPVYSPGKGKLEVTYADGEKQVFLQGGNISTNYAYQGTPTQREHYPGSLTYFSTTDGDGYIGKICTEQGTPGTWKRFKFTVEA